MKQLNRNRAWLKEEDEKLRHQINAEPKQNWKSVANKSGLKRSANSCRLRYVNHLKPRSRPGKLTVEEKLLTLEFRFQWGGRNCWSKIAKHLLSGRTDNDLKNFWHTLAKKANREGRDANSEAIRTRAELAETINNFGKFTMDYSSLISSDAYDLLKQLFPHIAVAGDGAATEAADCSSIITDGAVASVGCGFDVGTSSTLASPSTATDIGPGRVGYSELSHIVPIEADQLMPQEQQCVETPQSHAVGQQQLQKEFATGFFYYGGDPGTAPGSDPVPAAEPSSAVTGNPYAIAPQIHVPVQQHQQIGLFHHGGGPTSFNQVPVAALGSTFTETINQGLSHLQGQVTSIDSIHINTVIDAPQFPVPVELHEQLGFNSGFFDHGGGPIGFNKTTAGAALGGTTTSNEIDELNENKAFADYFDFVDIL